MMKYFFITSFILLTCIGCELEDITIPFNFERDAPSWLKIKIDSLSNTNRYMYMKVFRYEWRGNYAYYIMNPISSCAYCELYDQNGNKINFSDDETFQDFLINKKNEILVWEWRKKLTSISFSKRILTQLEP